MNIEEYQKDLREGVAKAISILSETPQFKLYSFSIWTDIEAGISAVAADTRENSEIVVRQHALWSAREAEKMRLLGDAELAEIFEEPMITRSRNPADFRYRELVTMRHSSWVASDNASAIWDVLEPILITVRDEASVLLASKIPLDDDAEVAISTRRDWYDASVTIRR